MPTVTGDAFADGLVAVVAVLPTMTRPLGDPPDADDNDGERTRFDAVLSTGAPESFGPAMMNPCLCVTVIRSIR